MQKCSSALQELRDALWEQEGSTRAHVHTIKKKHKRRHTYKHAHSGTAAKVQLHHHLHVSGASSDKNVTSVPHWGQGGESYMIGASIAACRSWHNEFNAIGLIWHPCQHLAASAWETHACTRMHTHAHTHTSMGESDGPRGISPPS